MSKYGNDNYLNGFHGWVGCIPKPLSKTLNIYEWVIPMISNNKFLDSNKHLYELIKEHGYGMAPTNIALHGSWFEVLIPIDADHTVKLLVERQDLIKLYEIMGHPSLPPS